MKKILSVLLCTLVIGSLMSCTTTSTTSVTENSEKIKEDLFLLLSSEGSSAITQKDTSFQTATSHGIGVSSQTVILNDLQSTTKDPFQNGEIFTYKKSTQYPKLDANHVSFYGQFDTYTNGKKAVEYLSGTNLITYYHNMESSNSEQSLTEDQYKQIADDFLAQCIPDKELSNYSYLGMDADVYGMIALCYTRYIDGYKTDDTLSVFFNKDGSVKGYNGRNTCKFNAVSTKLNKQILDDATSKLMQKIEALELTNLTSHSPVLTTNSSGEVFIQIVIEYETTRLDDIYSCTEKLYVRVN